MVFPGPSTAATRGPTPKWLLALVVGLVLVLVILHLTKRAPTAARGAGSATAASPRAVEPAPAPPAAAVPVDAGAPPAAPLVRRISATERRTTLDQIAKVRAQPAAAPAAPSAPTAAPSLPPPPTLGREEIRSAYKEIVPLLTECYDAALDGAGADALARIELTTEVQFIGAADVGTLVDEESLRFTPSQPLPAELEQCLRETLLSVELPPLADGNSLTVRYPFVFERGE